MGAVAPPTSHWIPEDDVLLRNAVEAGASLESLAKGAVQFSRRYTIQDLQDRWHSLLYNPSVSEDASVHMTEVERSVLMRPNRFEIKEITCSSRKRKPDSIRKYYCTVRKRLCSESFDMLGINLLPGPSDSNLQNGNKLASADCEIGNPVSNNLGIQGPDFDDIHDSFSIFGSHAAESALNGVIPNFSTVPHDHDLSYPYEENLSLTGDHGQVHGFDQSKELDLCNLFEAESLENEGNACSQFEDSAFPSFGCSSPLPQMSNWNGSPDIAAAGLSMDIVEEVQQTGDAFIIPQDEIEALRHDYLLELTDTLFANEDDLLFMDTDGRDPVDKSYLDGFSTLLLDSPNPSGLPNVSPSEVAVATDVQVVGTSGVHPEVTDNGVAHLSCLHKVPDAQVASSAPTVKMFGPEYRTGVICCTLNTEDPNIPSNDDVFLPFRFPSPSNSSGETWRLHDTNYQVSPSVSSFSSAQKANGGPPIMKNITKDSHMSSRVIGSTQPSDMDSKHRLADHGVKFELPKSNIHHPAPRNVRSSDYPNHINSENGAINGGSVDTERGKDLDDKPVHPNLNNGLDILQNHQKNASDNRNEIDVKAEVPTNGLSNVDLSGQQIIVTEPTDKSLPLDQEELWSETDFDVPYFSDVEALILDLDLSPDDFDPSTNPEVQRLEHEDFRRTVVRLEQAADACTHRTIAAHGAFAVLSGRFTKHFIKKPEVLLGRETEDFKVDIDLGRERNGSKISRRQALLKIDGHGMFHLKNLGKCSIHVNGKVVGSRQTTHLTSNSVIEVKGLSFLFETNPKLVKQYVDSTKEGSLLLDQKPANGG